MAEMLFYEKPVPLSSVNHADWTLRLPEPRFGFAASINSVVLAGIEFVEASKDYPIVFAKAADALVPVALLGLRETNNLYVDASGDWLNGHYVPAFIRRYPFVLAEGPGPEPVSVLTKPLRVLGRQIPRPLARPSARPSFLMGNPNLCCRRRWSFLASFSVSSIGQSDLLLFLKSTIC